MSRQSSQPQRRHKYTQHQRDKALADAETLGTCAAARKHGIPESTVSRWRSEQRRSGSASPEPEPTPKPPKTATQQNKIAPSTAGTDPR